MLCKTISWFTVLEFSFTILALLREPLLSKEVNKGSLSSILKNFATLQFVLRTSIPLRFQVHSTDVSTNKRPRSRILYDLFTTN